MKRGIVVLAAVVSLAAFTVAQAKPGTTQKKGVAPAGSDEQAILSIEDQLRNAALKGDTSFLQNNTSDDYVSISGATGRLATKAETMSMLQSGGLKYQSIDASEVKVHLHGDAALVTGLANVKGTLAGNDISGAYRFMRIYKKHGTKWLVIGFASVKAQ
jgi:ketosteroid isomerase-like protein